MTQKSKEKKPNYLSKAGLKARGWTDSIITKMKIEPVKYVRNPHYACAPEMGLYLESTILKKEKTEEFKKLKEQSVLRKAAAKKAVETKIKVLEQKCDSVLDTFNEESESLRSVVDKAIDAYNEFREFMCCIHNREYYYDVTIDNCDAKFLRRITLNYLRHECSEYDDFLECQKGQVGIDNAHYYLQNSLAAEAIKKYPELSAASFPQWLNEQRQRA